MHSAIISTTLMLSMCAAVPAELRSGSVTMSADSSGYNIVLDSLIIPCAANDSSADLQVRFTGFTATSCPGSSAYTITGCKNIWAFQVPVDSFDFSVALDTLDKTVSPRSDAGLMILAQTMYDRENKPDVAFLIRDSQDRFAVFRIISVETIPAPGEPLPGDCFDFKISSITMNWVYQDDGTLLFDPAVMKTNVALHRHINVRRLGNKTFISMHSFNSVKMPASVYDVLGRSRSLINHTTTGLFIKKISDRPDRSFGE